MNAGGNDSASATSPTKVPAGLSDLRRRIIPRLLVAGIVVPVIAFSWWQYSIARSVRRIEALGARVHRNSILPQHRQQVVGWQLNYGRVYLIDLRGTLVRDADLRVLSDFEDLLILMLDGTSISDDGLAHLHGLQNLQGLMLGKTQVKGAGLEHLAATPHLKWLTLSGSEIGDDDLERLPPLPELDLLGLGGTQITGRGLAQLRRFRSIRRLYLHQTGLCDDDMRQLPEFPQLMGLSLEGTNLTDGAIPQMPRFVQPIQIHRDGTRITAKGALGLNLPRGSELVLDAGNVTQEDVAILEVNGVKVSAQ